MGNEKVCEAIICRKGSGPKSLQVYSQRSNKNPLPREAVLHIGVFGEIRNGDDVIRSFNVFRETSHLPRAASVLSRAFQAEDVLLGSDLFQKIQGVGGPTIQQSSIA